MKRKLFTAVCILLASAIAPYGAFAKAKKDAKKDIGIQLYSVRDLIGSFGRNQHDYKPVLKALADMGYTSIEAASYNDGKFYGNTPEEFRRDVEAVGMKVLSSHCGKGLSDEELASGDFSESMKWWDQCIAAHKAAGMEYIVTPYLPVPKTLKEMQTYCDYLNAIGKKCREAGIKYGYHNHAHEFQKIEDKAVMLDYMIEYQGSPRNRPERYGRVRCHLRECQDRRCGKHHRRGRAIQLRCGEECQTEPGLPARGTFREGFVQQITPPEA